MTAAARFPYVLPAGALTGADKNGAQYVRDRVVDGGYFENFGAVTAEELLGVLLAGKMKTGEKAPDGVTDVYADGEFKFFPVVIQIVSDPDLDPELALPPVYKADSPSSATPHPPGRATAEVLSPISAFWNSRSGRAVLAMQHLKQTVNGYGGQFVIFSIRGNGKAGAAPLSWALSDQAKKSIGERRCQEPNKTAFGTLSALFAVSISC